MNDPNDPSDSSDSSVCLNARSTDPGPAGRNTRAASETFPDVTAANALNCCGKSSVNQGASIAAYGYATRDAAIAAIVTAKAFAKPKRLFALVREEDSRGSRVETRNASDGNADAATAPPATTPQTIS